VSNLNKAMSFRSGKAAEEPAVRRQRQ